jgi:hypothetical protein
MSKEVQHSQITRLAPETLQVNHRESLRPEKPGSVYHGISPRLFCSSHTLFKACTCCFDHLAHCILHKLGDHFQGTRVVAYPPPQTHRTVLLATMGSTELPTNDLPSGAWDSHVHVVDEDTFPLHPMHPYRPMSTRSGLTTLGGCGSMMATIEEEGTSEEFGSETSGLISDTELIYLIMMLEGTKFHTCPSPDPRTVPPGSSPMKFHP